MRRARYEPTAGGGGGGSGPLGRVFSARQVRWMQVDWHVLVLALILLSVGLVFLRAMDEADAVFQRSEVDFGSHLGKLVVAAPALVLGLLIRPRWLRRNAYLLYGACLVLLMLVPFIGQERNNARRWIQLPVGFDLQPSELAKLGVILALARVLYRSRLARPADWVGPLAIALAPMGMVALQPDLGTALTIAPISLGMLWLAGARARVLVLGMTAGAVLAFSAWHFEWVKSYQLQRVDTWIHSWEPAELIEGRNGPAFHSYHARTAIGNGAWTGTGLGRGVANEAGHLPERSSDSIFAVVAEEGGFLGAGGLIVLYALLIVLLLGSASTLRERFSRLVVGGVALYFAAHFFVNVGVNLGLLPMTGLTLPLLSTGGSSLLVTFGALGLALGLAAHREPSLDRDAFRL